MSLCILSSPIPLSYASKGFYSPTEGNKRHFIISSPRSDRVISPKRMFPQNINNFDNNIFNLAGRKPINVNGNQNTLFAYDQNNKLNQIKENIARHEKKSSASQHEFIFWKSKVPLKEENDKDASLDQYRKVLSPFANINVNSPNASKNETRGTLQEKFKSVYKSPQNTNIINNREEQHPDIPERVCQRESSMSQYENNPEPIYRKKHTKSQQDIYQQPALTKPNINSDDNKSCISHEEKQKYDQYIISLLNEKQRLEERLSSVRERNKSKKGLLTSPNIQAKATTYSEKYALKKTREQLGMSDFTDNDFLDVNFGKEHARIREAEKERRREAFRRDVLNHLITGIYKKFDKRAMHNEEIRKKEQLYFYI